MDEVGGAVQRIDDPHEFRRLGAMLAARFFGQDAVLRVSGEKGFDDGALARHVDLGHKIIELLLRDTHSLDVEGSSVDDGASGARSLDGHVKHGVQGRGRHGL
ncbi:hypothetical protein SDC9_149258 [bioreactor metagenome]|uniref:Uncharacterized protein n=1 Tax=bioreactor metagenome TaxID=1076179 RepID=A0A645EJ44_9ZZZZ